jgi:integrase
MLPYFGTRRLDSVRPVDIAMFLASGRIAALAPKYQLNLYGLLRLMFGVAVDYELIASSPVRPRVHRPHVDASEKPTLSGEEVARVIGYVEPAWQTAILCVALTGLRAGELAALQWKHVDLQRGTLVVAQSFWRGQLIEPKTKASRAEVPVSDVLHDALVGHRAASRHQEPDDYVFGDTFGRPVSPDFLRTQVLYPALERAGIPRVRRGSGLHLFRHTAASLVHKHTGSLKFAQALLRHARVSTTANVYTHVSAAESRGVAQALQDAIFANCALPVLTNGPSAVSHEQG